MNNNSLNLLGQLKLVETRGYSAYEVAVLNGYVGTEEEWLESLIGPQGPQGPDGRSAYQVAVDNGYIGTEEEWVHDFMTPDGYYTKAEVDNKLNKKPYYFTNVNAMKQSTLLKEGDLVITKGYRRSGDGGGAQYYISSIMSLTDYQEELGNGLYAILMITDTINVLQLGAKGNDTDDDSAVFNTLISCLKANEKINTVEIPNKTYLLNNRITIRELDNVTFNNHGILHRSSEEDTEYVFTISYCNNLIFNNLNLKSERDQSEDPPEGHTREVSTGSNIKAIAMNYCNNIHFNNSQFENMAIDFMNQGLQSEDDDTLRSNHIYINGWLSKNTSMPLYMSYITDCHISNAYVIPAEGMGGGDHMIYCSYYVKDFYINDSTFIAPDLYFGNAINYRHAGSNPSNLNAPKNLQMSNCYIECRSLMSVWYNTTATLNNCRFKALISDSSEYNVIIINGGSPSITFKECEFNNYNYRFLAMDSNANDGVNIKILNCIFNSINTNEMQIIYSTASNVKTEINNCIINHNAPLIYLATGTNNYYSFNNNDIIQHQNGTYAFSNRVTSNIITISNNVIYNTNAKTNLMYNNGVDNSNTKIYFNTITGYSQIASATDITTINNDYNAI